MSSETAVRAARKVIAARASDPKAKMFGLSGDLMVIGRALDELESSAGICAEFALLLYEALNKAGNAPRVHPGFVQSLGNLNANAALIARRILHGATCCCAECMPGVMKK